MRRAVGRRASPAGVWTATSRCTCGSWGPRFARRPWGWLRRASMPGGGGATPRGTDAPRNRPHGCRRRRPLTDYRFDGLDRLELRDLRPPVLPVRGDAHVRAELFLGLVDR